MKILLLDIETAPHKVYAWGLFDQNISTHQIQEPGYTLCWAAKWLGAKDISFSSIIKDGRKRMIGKVHKLMNEADAIVHYNGTRFDIPTLNQEMVLLGLTPPAPYKQIDLLKTVKRQFKLPSNKLDYVAKHLGVKGKLPNKGMDLWKGCMAGKPDAWKDMEAYNTQDIICLEDVYNKMRPWIINHPNQNLFGETASMRCHVCGGSHLQKRGFSRTAAMIYQRFQCKDCGAWNRSRLAVVPKETRDVVLVEDKG